MSTVGQLLRAIRQEEVFSVGPMDTVFDAIDIMAKRNIGAVVVIDKGRLVGILSERDLVRRVLLSGKDINKTFVKDVMTNEPEFVSPHAVLEDVERLMASLNVRHVPVVDNGKVVGIVSIKDILVVTRRDQELLALQYLSYIGGRS